MNPRARSRALARLVTALPALAMLLAVPAKADEPLHAEAKPARGDDRAGLLILSLLVPLPLPLALIAPPSSSRPPVATGPSRQAPASPAGAARVAKRAASN